MSRSYRKPKAFICSGSNTEYYRDRNRSTRAKNRHKLRKFMLNDPTEDEAIDFVPNKKNKAFDTWSEPTDGSYLATDDGSEYYKKLCRK